MPRIHNVHDVAQWRLCLGCGACAYICPDQKVRLVDVLEEGIRPFVEAGNCVGCSECLQVCPSVENDHSEINARTGVMAGLTQFCGPVLEIWEGHASDPEIRFRGASGGALTALALFCLEKAGMHGVLHIGMQPDDATRNCTKMSRTRSDLLANTGSRYAPASACDRLDLIENAPAPCVFIGQPTEVTALRKAERLRPALRQKVGLALSFFCAGAPARKGTLELLKSRGVDPGKVETLKYRGSGWPGLFSALVNGEQKPACEMTYKESWGFVQAYRPFSTQLCPDGTGEDADISCGDPWYQEVPENAPGSSLVVVRTERGRALLRDAMKAGVLELTPAEPWKLLDSQKNLIGKRGAVGGRLMMMRMLGLPAPQLRGFSLFKNWLRLNLKQKARSTVGMVRRIFQSKYHRPLVLRSPEVPRAPRDSDPVNVAEAP